MSRSFGGSRAWVQTCSSDGLFNDQVLLSITPRPAATGVRAKRGPKIVDRRQRTSLLPISAPDPDQQFYENFVCKAVRNYTSYCNPEVDKLIDQQSAEPNRERRKQLVWRIERRLAEKGARPIIFYPLGGTCTQPSVKGPVILVISIYNGYRMEDVWLDK